MQSEKGEKNNGTCKESKKSKSMGQAEMNVERNLARSLRRLGKDICQKKLSKQCKLRNMQGQRQQKEKVKQQVNSMLNNQNQLQRKQNNIGDIANDEEWYEDEKWYEEKRCY